MDMVDIFLRRDRRLFSELERSLEKIMFSKGFVTAKRFTDIVVIPFT